MTEQGASVSAMQRAARYFWTLWVALGTLVYWTDRGRWEWIGGPWLSPFTFGLPWLLFGVILWFPLYFWLADRSRTKGDG